MKLSLLYMSQVLLTTLSKMRMGGLMERTAILLWLKEKKRMYLGKRMTNDDEVEGTIRKTADGEEEEYWSDDDGDARADDTADASTRSTYFGLLRSLKLSERSFSLTSSARCLR